MPDSQKRKSRRLVQICREHNSQNAGQNKELRALRFFSLPCVHSVCTVSSGANEILEDYGAVNLYLQVLGPALSKVCS